LQAWLYVVDPSAAQLRAGNRRGTLAGTFVPVLAGLQVLDDGEGAAS
jgi:hypothetical protein